MSAHPSVPREIPASLTIDATTLRDWLDRHEPVTVLDVRPAHQRAEWAIPGSIHLDAYEALWADDPAALSRAPLPQDVPVVTVCAEGKTSLIAALQLRERGVPARSLVGGMRAWSLAWNGAKVSLPGAAVDVLQVRRTGKGCLSYLIGGDGEAAVIDPSVSAEVYQRLASERGWTIVEVLDTHVHADHLSRGRALSERTGATYRLPEQQRVSFDYSPVSEGTEIAVGPSRLVAWRVPGHTMESTAYLLEGHAMFTGDTLFLNSVGRPDLEAAPGETRKRAEALHASLERLFTLAAETAILPGHTSAPVEFDSRPIAAPLSEVRSRLPAVTESRRDFVEYLLRRIPPTPPNHKLIVRLNEAGILPEGDPADFEAGANRCAVS